MLFIEFNLFCQYCSSLLYKSLRGNFDSDSTCFLQNLGSNQNGTLIFKIDFHSEKWHFRLELSAQHLIPNNLIFVQFKTLSMGS